MKLKVGVRILLGYGVLIIMFGMVSIFAYSSLTRIENLKGRILENQYPGVMLAKDLLIGNRGETLAVQGYVATGDKAYLAEYQYSKIKTRENSRKSLEAALTDEERNAVTAVATLAERYEAFLESLIEERDNGNGARALERMNSGAKTEQEAIGEAINSLL